MACSWCVSKPACSPVLGGVTARSAQLPRQGARQPATATCPAVSTGMPTSTLWSWQLPRHSQAGYVPWVILASCWQGKEESRKAWAQRPRTLGGGPQPSNVISKLFLQGIRQNSSAPRMSLVTSPWPVRHQILSRSQCRPEPASQDPAKTSPGQDLSPCLSFGSF